MSSKKPKATRKRMISCFAQIVQEHIPGWKIEEIASGEKVKARKFSYSSQVYLLMLSQFLHLFSLNEIVDATTGGCRDSGCGTSTPSTRPPSCS